METTRTETDRLFDEFRRTGDARALGEVYDRIAPELRRVALHTTRDPSEAEDLLQATLLAAIEQAQRYDPERRVLPWLMGILALEARKARERGVRRPDPERVTQGTSPAPDEEAERAELLAELDAALVRIPAAFKPVLRLRLRHGLSVPEIAAALGRPPGTVRSQLARGTELLRNALPAGLAGALALVMTPRRGLAAVRAAVVEHAARGRDALRAPLSRAQGALDAVHGVLAGNKLVTLVAALIAAVSLVLVTRGSDEARAQLAHEASPPLARTVPLESSAEPAAAARSPERTRPFGREPLAAGAAPERTASVLPATTTELVVTATWPDGTRAAGEMVLVRDALSARADDGWEELTDAHGEARFQGLAPGTTHVRLLRGGEGTARLALGRTTEVTLAIRPGVTVDGRVLDARGEPLAGAEVWLSERYRNNVGYVVAHTDADGGFRLHSVGPDHWVGARMAGLSPSGLAWLGGGHGDVRELVLVLDRPGARVRGQVVDADGEPLARAQVMLGEERPASVRVADGSFAPSAPPQCARTDANGRFELASVPPGLLPLQVRAVGRAPYVGELEVLYGIRNEVTVTLQPAPRVVGRVRTSGGKAVPAAWVHAGDTELFASSSTWSRPDGRFELNDLGLGRQTILAQHEEGEARLEVELAAGETRELEVELRSVPRIHGRVVDARGAPLEGLTVVAVHDEDRSVRTRSEPSDAQGRFTLGDLEERAYLVWVQPGEEAGGWRGFPLLEQADVWPDAPLELRVPDTRERGRIVAEVVAPDGEPVVGAELQVWHEEARQWRSFPSGGARGAVAAEGVPAGTVELEVRHADHPWKRLGRHTLAPGGTLELGRITFDPSGHLRVRLGGVAGPSAAAADPVGELELEALLVDASNKESGVARFGPGEMTAGPLAPGEHLLVLGGDGVRQIRLPFRIEAGLETRLELELEACGAREVAFALPEETGGAKWIGCSLLDAQGALVWGGNADCTREPPAVRLSAPPGVYTLMAGAGGLAGQIEVVLGAHGVELPTLVLRLAPKP